MGCDNGQNKGASSKATSDREILVFCGITMIEPIMVLSRIAESKFNVKIKLSYGGSLDLAKSIEVNKFGDIYFPGTKAFVEQMAQKNLVARSRQMGYNQITFFVQKGNPRQISGDLSNLLNPDLSVAIGHKDLGSVGREARDVLIKKGIYEQVTRNAAFMASDSKGMTMGLREKRVDLVLNWRSVLHFKDNKDYMDEVPIEPGYASRHTMAMARLVYSKYPKIADQFLDLCASRAGQDIFRQYGF